jgi:hypothetical protein
MQDENSLPPKDTTGYLTEIGRLTASIVHEINNPMQAIRGAVALTLEEADQPQAVRDYMGVCLEESDRVIHLVNLIRGIYRPQTERQDPVSLENFLKDILMLVREEAAGHGLSVETQISQPEQWISGNIQHYQMAVISSLLHLFDEIQPYCDKVMIKARRQDQMEEILLIPVVRDELSEGKNNRGLFQANQKRMDLTLSMRILEKFGGKLTWMETESNGEPALCFQFPLTEGKGGMNDKDR